jgi:hypothetical protein
MREDEAFNQKVDKFDYVEYERQVQQNEVFLKDH